MVSSVPWHPEVVEDDEYRMLRFAELDIQSKMRKAAPYELVFSYTQAMMAFLLFNEAPKHILVVGLGGGSLPKFCYRHLPGARITTVEISREVIDLRERFCIPPDDERFCVVHDDIAHWLEGKENIADVILLDAFSEIGIPAAISSLPFYRRCRRALTDDGILALNVNLGISKDSLAARRKLEKAIGRTLSVRSVAGHNDVLLSFRNAELPEVKVLKARAVALRDRTGVDFPLLLDRLRSSAVAAQGGRHGS